MNYKKAYVPRIGYTPLCEDGDTSFRDLRFGMIELGKGDALDFDTGEREVAFILLSGHADFTFDGQCYQNVGGRRAVFEGKAHAVYMPRRKTVRIAADERVKMAVCAVPIAEDTAPKRVTPADVSTLALGVKPWQRETHFIIGGETGAKRLFVGEAFVTPGNWAGFPPHKHDVDNMPFEDVQEELYYFLFDPPQGFALQRLYTKDGTIDETYCVKRDELVEFPRGYHTTVGAPGYNTWFLWASSVTNPGMYRSPDPDHQWVTAVENLIKKG